MLYFGDMVSLSPFLEILRREAVGSKITLVIDARFQEAVRIHLIIRSFLWIVKRWGFLLLGNWGRNRKTHLDILMVLHGRRVLSSWRRR